jgi:hypothetical protein
VRRLAYETLFLADYLIQCTKFRFHGPCTKSSSCASGARSLALADCRSAFVDSKVFSTILILSISQSRSSRPSSTPTYLRRRTVLWKLSFRPRNSANSKILLTRTLSSDGAAAMNPFVKGLSTSRAIATRRRIPATRTRIDDRIGTAVCQAGVRTGEDTTCRTGAALSQKTTRAAREHGSYRDGDGRRRVPHIARRPFRNARDAQAWHVFASTLTNHGCRCCRTSLRGGVLRARCAARDSRRSVWEAGISFAEFCDRYQKGAGGRRCHGGHGGESASSTLDIYIGAEYFRNNFLYSSNM